MGAGPQVSDPTKSFDGNPATRPTPGFTEIEVRPATSETLPAPASFLKDLALLDTLTEIDEVRFFTQDLQMIGNSGPAFNLAGPFVVRLIQAGNIVDEALPEFGGAVVANGDYSSFDLKFANLIQEQIPSEAEGDAVVTGELVNHSMVVEGSFKGPDLAPILGIRIPFRYVSHETSTVRIQGATPLSLTGDYTTLFIAFKIQTWFDQNILSQILSLDAQVLLNGVLILDTESLDPILKNIALQIEAQVNTSLRLAPSEDGVFQESDVDENSSSSVIVP